jgi:hypothetical protein
MHAKPEWLPREYKDWNALLTAAVRKAMHDGHTPAAQTKHTLRLLP